MKRCGFYCFEGGGDVSVIVGSKTERHGHNLMILVRK